MEPEGGRPAANPLNYSSIEFDLLECNVCMGNMKETITSLISAEGQHECGHSYCEACANNIMQKAARENKPPLCPYCRAQVARIYRNQTARLIAAEAVESKKRAGDANLALVNIREQIEKDKERYQEYVTKKVEEYKLQLKEFAERADKENQELTENLRKERTRSEELEILLEREKESWRKHQHTLEKERQELETDMRNQLDKQKHQAQLTISNLEQEKDKEKDKIKKDFDELQAQYYNMKKRVEITRMEKDNLKKNLSSSILSPAKASPDNSSWTASAMQSVWNGTLYFSGWATPTVSGPLTFNFADFRVLERRGNRTSSVWKGYHTTSDRFYALKKISLPSNSKAVSVLREAMLVHKFSHDNVIRLEGITKDLIKGDIYLVLPYLEYDLEYCLETYAFNDERIRDAMFYIISAVRYLHEMEIAHLDIRPTSVLIDTDGSLSGLKLTSMSTSRSTLSVPFCLPSSPPLHYRAPELFYMEHTSIENWKAVDVWSLGILFFQLLTKKLPFDGYSPTALLSSILSTTQTRPTLDIIAQSVTLQNIESRLNANHISLNHFLSPHHHNSNGRQTTQRSLLTTLPTNTSEDAKKLLFSMLTFDPYNRPNILTILSHPYFKDGERKRIFSHSRPSSEFKDDLISKFIEENCPGILG